MSRYNLSDEDYTRLLSFRTGLRQFLRWSELSAHRIGITPAQHQLLLAVRGHHDKNGPTISDLAEYLVSQHHSVGGLVQRALDAGLVQRFEDLGDRRISRIRLTERGETALEELSSMHIEELARLANKTASLWEGLTNQKIIDEMASSKHI